MGPQHPCCHNHDGLIKILLVYSLQYRGAKGLKLCRIRYYGACYHSSCKTDAFICFLFSQLDTQSPSYQCLSCK